MARKIIARVTLAAFLVFSWSCVIYRWKPNRLESVKPEKRAAVKICAVQLKSGQKIEFSKSPPARIQGYSVAGNVLKSLSFEKSEIRRPKCFITGILTKIETSDGTIYSGVRVSRIEKTRVSFDYDVPSVVPLAEVDLLWIKKVDALGTALLYIIPIGAVTAIVAIAWAGQSIGPFF